MKLEELIVAAREEHPSVDPLVRARLRRAVSERVRASDRRPGSRAAPLLLVRGKTRTVVFMAAAAMMVVSAGFAATGWRHRPLAVPAVASGRTIEGADRRSAPRLRLAATTPPIESLAAIAPQEPREEATMTSSQSSPPRHRERTGSPGAPSSEIDGEMALLRDAREGLRRGDGLYAIAALDRYDHRFKGGSLSQEATALRIVALCAAGRVPEARERAAAFLKEWPQSPMRVRIERSCLGSPTH